MKHASSLLAPVIIFTLLMIIFISSDAPSAKYQHITDVKVEILRVCVQCYTSYYRCMLCDQEKVPVWMCAEIKM